MNLNEFLKELAALPVKWKVIDGAIRSEYGHCPLIVVARCHGYGWNRNSRFGPAASDLGLTIQESLYVANAADYAHCHGRDRLEEACHLGVGEATKAVQKED